MRNQIPILEGEGQRKEEVKELGSYGENRCQRSRDLLGLFPSRNFFSVKFFSAVIFF